MVVVTVCVVWLGGCWKGIKLPEPSVKLGSRTGVGGFGITTFSCKLRCVVVTVVVDINKIQTTQAYSLFAMGDADNKTQA